MNNLLKRKPWLYCKKGDCFEFKCETYEVRLNCVNDIFFSDKELIILESDLDNQYELIQDDYYR